MGVNIAWMPFRTRRNLTLTTLLSGFLAAGHLLAADKNGLLAIVIEPIGPKSSSPTPLPNKQATASTPAVQKHSATPTSTPTKTSTPAPKWTSTPTASNTFTPFHLSTFSPTPTAVRSKPSPSTPEPGTAPKELGSQFSLSLDVLGEGLFKARNGANYFGAGGQAFLDWRPIQYISFGLGGQFGIFPDTTQFTIGTLDFGGRIFPLPLGTTPGGEFFLQGGLGFNLSSPKQVPGNYHGYAGAGYRQSLSDRMALDFGAQYDLFSPLASSTHSIGVKAGLTFLFGRTRFPDQVGDNVPYEGEGTAFHPRAGSFQWQAGDTLRSLSARMLGDPDLYPLLVDANRDLFRTGGIKPGTVFHMPSVGISQSELDAYRSKSLIDPHFTKLEKESRHYGYQADPSWQGPSSYTLHKGESLQDAAQKVYGDGDLYPLLVDANEKKLIHPANLRDGVKLKVPAPPLGEWKDVVHQWGWTGDPYIWWRNTRQYEIMELKKPKPTPSAKAKE